jgi:hypothetical protein
MSGAASSADATFEIAAIAIIHSGSSGLLALALVMRWSTASAFGSAAISAEIAISVSASASYS